MSTDNTPTDDSTDHYSTGVYVAGVEMAVRTTSRYSRTAHIPATDADGNVRFDDDGHPKTACNVEAGKDELPRKLVPVHTVANRGECRNCESTDAEISARNRKGAARASWARRMRFDDDWGAEQ